MTKYLALTISLLVGGLAIAQPKPGRFDSGAQMVPQASWNGDNGVAGFYYKNGGSPGFYVRNPDNTEVGPLVIGGGSGSVSSVGAGDSTVTLSPSPIVSSGTVKVNRAATFTWSGQHTFTHADGTIFENDGIGTNAGSAAGVGIDVRNNTNAGPGTPGTPQNSPTIRLTGSHYTGGDGFPRYTFMSQQLVTSNTGVDVFTISSGIFPRWQLDNLGAQTWYGDADANTHLIHNVVDPVSAQDAATKNSTDTHSIAGDVTGTLAASTVAKLQGRTVASTAPTDTYYLGWNAGASQWEPKAIPATGVTSVGTGNGLQGGTITTTGTIDLRLNASGGLTKTLGGGANELGIAAAGVTAAMLAASGVTAATYGDASHVGQCAYNAGGEATSCSNVSIAIAESAVTNLTTDLAAKATDSLVVHLAGTESITGQKTFPAAGASAVRIPAIYAGASNTNGHVVPNVADDTFALIAAAQVLTGKTINGASNTLTVRAASDITGTLPNANLVNSGALTVTAGTGLSGGGSVALGATTTLTTDETYAHAWTGAQTYAGATEIFIGATSTGGSTTNSSPTLKLRGTYWNGSASVNDDATVQYVVTATTPAGYIDLVPGNSAVTFRFNHDGGFSMGDGHGAASATSSRGRLIYDDTDKCEEVSVDANGYNVKLCNGSAKLLGTSNQLLLGAASHLVTISSTAPAGAGQTLTIPDTAGADTFVFTTLAQTLASKTLTAPIINGVTAASGNVDWSGTGGTYSSPTGANTFGGSTNTFTNAITIRPTTNQIALGGASHLVTISSTAPAGAASTATLPDIGASDTFAFIALAQELTSKTLTAPVMKNGWTASGSSSYDSSGSLGTWLPPTGGLAANLVFNTDNSRAIGSASVRASGVTSKLLTTSFASGDSVLNTLTKGLDLVNLNTTTTAGDANQVYSPTFHLQGAGAKTSATATSQTQENTMVLRPVSGAAASTYQIAQYLNRASGGNVEYMDWEPADYTNGGFTLTSVGNATATFISNATMNGTATGFKFQPLTGTSGDSMFTIQESGATNPTFKVQSNAVTQANGHLIVTANWGAASNLGQFVAKSTSTNGPAYCWDGTSASVGKHCMIATSLNSVNGVGLYDATNGAQKWLFDWNGLLTVRSGTSTSGISFTASATNAATIYMADSATDTANAGLALKGGAAGAASASNAPAAGPISITGGIGGAGTTTKTASAGAIASVVGGLGGTGAASVNGPANGGGVSITGGAGGTVTSGFSGANGGTVTIRGGALSGTGTKGNVTIGDSNTANVNIGAAATIINMGQGTVTQATNCSTGVTVNASSMVITSATCTTAARTSETAFTVTNSAIAAASSVQCEVTDYSGTYFTNGFPEVRVKSVAAGSFQAQIMNVDATNALNGTLKLQCTGN